jgi:hypothetical protein
MCLTDQERETQREGQRQRIATLSPRELLSELRQEYKRAGWQSPEDFSDQPNHPHVKLGWYIDELEKRAGIASVPEAPEGIFFIYKGWRFTPPFHCMYCGVEVGYKQWAFSRSCGGCDVGNSNTAKLHLHQWTAGPHEVHDRNDSHFMREDCFVPLEEVQKMSPRNPRKPFFPPIPPLPEIPPFPPLPPLFPRKKNG